MKVKVMTRIKKYVLLKLCFCHYELGSSIRRFSGSETTLGFTMFLTSLDWTLIAFRYLLLAQSNFIALPQGDDTLSASGPLHASVTVYIGP